MIFRYSQLDAYLQCPMRYYRQYVLNERGPTSIDLEFGTALHLAIKTHFDGEDSIAAFNMYWGSLDFKSMPKARFDSEYLHSMATKTFIPNFIRLHSKKFISYTQEVSLSMPIPGGHTLQGTYDMFGDYEGLPTVVDWKTSGKEYYHSKILKNPQMYIYAALIKHNNPTAVVNQLMYKVFIKSEGRIQTVKTNVTEEKLRLHLENCYSIIDSIVHTTNTGKWYSNHNCFCEGCFSDNKRTA